MYVQHNIYHSPIYTPTLTFPLKNITTNGAQFLEETTIDKIYWGKHLGSDFNAVAGTEVYGIGAGKVLYAKLHAAKKQQKGIRRNWGYIVIVIHRCIYTSKFFYSLYGHLAEPLVRVGETITTGQVIAHVAKEYTLENGWWEAHLHLGIYRGPWEEKVLPGYYRKDQQLTELEYWKDPLLFIENYQRGE
jgi:murein DD-endopeptidase MepM/ murein hydrolase activator NlpD